MPQTYEAAALARVSWVVVLGRCYQTFLLWCRLETGLFASLLPPRETPTFHWTLTQRKNGADETAVCKPGEGFIFSSAESQRGVFTCTVNGIFKQIHYFFFIFRKAWHRKPFHDTGETKEVAKKALVQFRQQTDQRHASSANSSAICFTSLFIFLSRY